MGGCIRQTDVIKQTAAALIASNPRRLPVESSSRRRHRLIENKTAPASSRGISTAEANSKGAAVTSQVAVSSTVNSNQESRSPLSGTATFKST